MILKIKALTMYLLFYLKISKLGKIYLSHEKYISCFFHYYPLHISSFGKKFSRTNMKNTNRIYNGLVRLPIYLVSKRQKLLELLKKLKDSI